MQEKICPKLDQDCPCALRKGKLEGEKRLGVLGVEEAIALLQQYHQGTGGP